jgi:hypothetical protein
MITFRPKDRISVAAGPSGARFVILGGATLGGPRYICWNFVSSRREKIETAKEKWLKGEWGTSACSDYLAKLRWPAHMQRAGSMGSRRVTIRGGRQTSVTEGTLFADTHLPLRLWFEAFWRVTPLKKPDSFRRRGDDKHIGPEAL